MKCKHAKVRLAHVNTTRLAKTKKAKSSRQSIHVPQAISFIAKTPMVFLTRIASNVSTNTKGFHLMHPIRSALTSIVLTGLKWFGNKVHVVMSNAKTKTTRSLRQVHVPLVISSIAKTKTVFLTRTAMNVSTNTKGFQSI